MELPAKRLALILLLAVLAAVSGVLVAVNGSPDAGEDEVVFEAGGGAAPWPQDTLRDWASYADRLSVFSVVGEERLPVHQGEGGTGGYRGRAVTLRLESTPWRRAKSPETGETIRIITWGWMERNGGLVAGKVEDGVRLEVGGRYLAPLTRRADGSWTLFADHAVLTLDDNVVTGRVDAGTPSAPVRALRTQTVGEAARTLAAVEPDPVATKYADLPADERWEAVSAEVGP